MVHDCIHYYNLNVVKVLRSVYFLSDNPLCSLLYPFGDQYEDWFVPSLGVYLWRVSIGIRIHSSTGPMCMRPIV